MEFSIQIGIHLSTYKQQNNIDFQSKMGHADLSFSACSCDLHLYSITLAHESDLAIVEM